MVNENYFKVKKLLLYGMIGAVLTMIGDFLLLGVDSNGAIGDRKSTRLNSSHASKSRMPSSA